MADPYRVTYSVDKAGNPLSLLQGSPVLSTTPAAAPMRATPQSYFTGGWPIPMMTSGMLFRDVGSSGLRQYGGWVREEFLPQLQGRQASRTYGEMMNNSSVVGSILFAIIATLRKVEWRVEPADDTPAAAEAAEFVEGLMDDMSHTWPDFVQEMQSKLGYGFSFHEICYKRRLGRTPGLDPQNPQKRLPISKFSDGMIGWRRLPIRGQDTIIKWFFDKSGSVQGVTQQPWIGPLVDIPIEKGLLFRPAQFKGNPEGKALDPETLIPTRDGWKKLDDVKPGDTVFDETGRVRYVTSRADWFDRPCYRIKFNDGTEIVADAEHEWQVNWAKRPNAGVQIMTTKALAESRLRTKQGGGLFSIDWAKPLDYAAQSFLVEPYILGVWLGDGSSHHGIIACHEDDIGELVESFAAAGYAGELRAVPDSKCVRFTPSGTTKWARDGLRSRLHALGLLGNKHLPSAYLRGSIAQRKELLQGLMDTDGHVSTMGQCTFCNTNASLAFGVLELVRSLGIAARIRSRAPQEENRYKGALVVGRSTVWSVCFTPDFPAFKLKRKLQRQVNKPSRMRHYIHSVEPCEPRRTVCIEIDGPSHLFLAGESMIPTHNSILRTCYRSYYLAKRLEEQEAIIFERLAGYPVIKIPNQVFELAASGDSNATAKLEAFKTIVRNVRIDEQMGLVIPSDMWEAATGGAGASPQYSFELVAPQGRINAVDSDKSINRYNINMMTAVMADFLQLGHGARGTQALATSKVDMFFQAIEGWLNSDADVINRFGLPRLWDLNGLDHDLMPRIVPDLAQRMDLDVLSNTLLRLSQAGMPLFPDQDLEDWARDAMGAPGRPEDLDGFLAAALNNSPVDETTGTAVPVSAPQAAAGGMQQRALQAAVKSLILRKLRKSGRLTVSTRSTRTTRTGMAA